MSDDRILKLENLLSIIKSEIPGTRGSLIINDDGFIIASNFNGEPDFQKTVLLFSSVIKSGDNFSGKIFNENNFRISIQSKKGNIQLFPVNEIVTLVIISNLDTKPGLLLLRIKKIVGILKQIVNKKNK